MRHVIDLAVDQLRFKGKRDEGYEQYKRLELKRL